MKRILISLMLVISLTKLHAEDQTTPLASINSLYYEAGCKGFIAVVDNKVLRNGKEGDHKTEMAKELAGLTEGLSIVLDLKEIRVIDFTKLEDSFKGLNQNRLLRVFDALNDAKYTEDKYYGLILISKYKQEKPYLAVNVLVFRKSDWKIVHLCDN